MNETTLKRFERILAIYIQLQSKRIVKAQDLADRFSVSIRTIYRDMKTLEKAGVPLLADAGTGYSLMEGYKLPPVMFTPEETNSFVAAEKLMQQWADKSVSRHFSEAILKIKSLLRWEDKDRVNLLDEQIQVMRTRTVFKETAPNAMEILMKGISQKKQVYIRYQSFEADVPNERYIEPIGLYHENNFWYLLAYCHLRKGYRKFRSDRIEAIKATNLPFTITHDTLENLLQKENNPPENRGMQVKISMSKKTAKQLENSRHYYGFVAETIKDDSVEMTFWVQYHKEYFIYWFLSMGTRIRVIEPESIKHDIKEVIQRIQKEL